MLSRLTRLRLIPWLLLFEAVRTVRTHVVERLTADDRRRVTEIVRRTKGDPRKVTDREKADLRTIAKRLEVAGLARDLVPTLVRAGRRRGRR